MRTAFVSLGVVGVQATAESLILDLASGTFTAEKVKTGMFPWVIEADQMIASDSSYTLSNASYKHENHDRFSPSFLIDRTTYDINSTTAIAEGIRLSIDGKTIGRIPELKKEIWMGKNQESNYSEVSNSRWVGTRV